MKILLVTFSEFLPKILTKILNPENEYSAVVTDDPIESKKIFENLSPKFLPEGLFFYLYELKECIQNLNYDVCICMLHGELQWEIYKLFRKYKLSRNKFLNFNFANNYDFLIHESMLHYYSKNFSKFEMFATGISYIAVCLDSNKFKYKLYNFARSSQDLYYDYKIAKFAISLNKKLKFALIGLAPYSFHYDLSKSYSNHFKLIDYLITFDDLHNFWLPKDIYRNLLQENFLSLRESIKNLDENNVGLEKRDFVTMDFYQKIYARDTIEYWDGKYFPETLAENLQIFDDYLTLCEENNIRQIVFLPPMTEGYKKYFNQSMLQEFYEIVNSTLKKFPKAVFVDGFKMSKIFSDEDFYDTAHLNIRGAEKFSFVLNQIIEKIENF